MTGTQGDITPYVTDASGFTGWADRVAVPADAGAQAVVEAVPGLQQHLLLPVPEARAGPVRRSRAAGESDDDDHDHGDDPELSVCREGARRVGVR